MPTHEKPLQITESLLRYLQVLNLPEKYRLSVRLNLPAVLLHQSAHACGGVVAAHADPLQPEIGGCEPHAQPALHKLAQIRVVGAHAVDAGFLRSTGRLLGAA